MPPATAQEAAENGYPPVAERLIRPADDGPSTVDTTPPAPATRGAVGYRPSRCRPPSRVPVLRGVRSAAGRCCGVGRDSVRGVGRDSWRGVGRDSGRAVGRSTAGRCCGVGRCCTAGRCCGVGRDSGRCAAAGRCCGVGRCCTAGRCCGVGRDSGRAVGRCCAAAGRCCAAAGRWLPAGSFSRTSRSLIFGTFCGTLLPAAPAAAGRAP